MSAVALRANGPEARQAMFLKTIPLVWRSFDAWPTPTLSSVRGKHQDRFKRLCKAARLFLLEQPMEDVLEAAGVGERQFHDLMRNALATRSDGTEIQGARAFVHCKVQPARVRTAPMQSFAESYVGYGGVFGQLMRDKPGIGRKLELHLDGLQRPNRITPQLLHAAFLRFAREEGVGEDEYPLNTASKAKKPLVRWFKAVYQSSRVIRHIRRQCGKDAATAAAFSKGDGTAKVTHEGYTALVIDAVKVDLRCSIDLPSTRFGSERVRVGETQGLLARTLAPVSLNAAWHLCLRKQASADDVLLLLRNAIMGRELSIAPERQWALHEGAGFPAHLLVALRYAAPLHVYLDNALAHLADTVQYFLIQIGGGEVHLGTPAMPKSRAEIEAAFSRYLNDFIHQMPGTTGTGPTDPLRKAAEVTPQKSVPWWLLDEASQAYFGNENVTPSAGAGYLDAMTRLRDLVESDGLQLNFMPPGRRKPHHFSMPEEVRVKCNLNQGRLPYVWTMYRRYSSDWLKAHPELKGKRFWVRHNPDDLSRAVLMDDDDTEVDVLRAEGQWGLFSHNLQVFKIYTRYKHLGMQARRAYEAPLHMVLQHMVEIAPTDTAAARDLAYLIAYFKRCLSPEALSQVGAADVIARVGRSGPTQIVVPHDRPLVSPPKLKVPTKPTALPAGQGGRASSSSFTIPRRIS